MRMAACCLEISQCQCATIELLSLILEKHTYWSKRQNASLVCQNAFAAISLSQ